MLTHPFLPLCRIGRRFSALPAALFLIILSLSSLPKGSFAQSASPGEEEIVLLKNESGQLPIPGQPDIAVVEFGEGDLTPFMQVMSRNFLHIQKYVHPGGELSREDSRLLSSTLQLYDRVLVLLLPGGENYSDELLEVLRGGGGTLVVMTGAYAFPGISSAAEAAGGVVFAGGASPEVQEQAAALISGERPFGAKLAVELSPLFRRGDGLSTKKTRLGYASPEEVGMDSVILKKIDRIAKEGLKAGAYPGAQILAAKDGYIFYEKAFGYRDAAKKEPNDLTTLYDLASITKAAATNPLLMMAVTQGLVRTTDKASKYLTYLRGSDKADIRIRDLLFHAAGMPAVIQFYKEILIDPNSYDEPLFSAKRNRSHPIQIAARSWARNDWSWRKKYLRSDSSALFPIRMADGLYLSTEVRGMMRREIRDAHLRKGYRYSDIDFLILQDLLEEVYGGGLDTLFREGFSDPLGLKRLLYRPLRKYPAEEIAEDTRDRFLRKQTLRGDVDDEAAAMLGGVSGNAGLFGNARDLAVLVQMYANGGVYGGLRFIDEEVLERFTTGKHPTSPYAMGFDRHRGPGKPGNTAEEAPLSTYGHTGFTGTCFWVDPEGGITYIFLSNRVAPTRWNTTLSRMDIRTRIQSVLYEALKQ